MKADNERSILIDIDGTLYDNFKRDDHKIISKMFGKNLLIAFIDKILWSINSLHIITNTMRILRVRLTIYAILSFKNVELVQSEYRQRYQNLLKASLSEKTFLLRNLSREYQIILVTNNAFAVFVLENMTRYKIIYAKNLKSRRAQIKAKHIDKELFCVIGDNYTDDIHFARKLNVMSIYIGNSILRKFFKSDYTANDLYHAIQILKSNS